MPTTYEYVKDGGEIYRESFATIRREADLRGLPDDVARVAVRMIHAMAQTDLVPDLAWTPGVVASCREALAGGAPILCDSTMTATGIIRSRLPRDNDVVCHLGEPEVAELARELGTTKSATDPDKPVGPRDARHPGLTQRAAGLPTVRRLDPSPNNVRKCRGQPDGVRQSSSGMSRS